MTFKPRRLTQKELNDYKQYFTTGKQGLHQQMIEDLFSHIAALDEEIKLLISKPKRKYGLPTNGGKE